MELSGEGVESIASSREHEARVGQNWYEQSRVLMDDPSKVSIFRGVHQRCSRGSLTAEIRISVAFK